MSFSNITTSVGVIIVIIIVVVVVVVVDFIIWPFFCQAINTVRAGVVIVNVAVVANTPLTKAYLFPLTIRRLSNPHRLSHHQSNHHPNHPPNPNHPTTIFQSTHHHHPYTTTTTTSCGTIVVVVVG